MILYRWSAARLLGNLNCLHRLWLDALNNWSDPLRSPYVFEKAGKELVQPAEKRFLVFLR
jgi:hypothetical protein